MEFRGVYTALVTPFSRGEVDYAKLRELVERQVKAKVAGIVPVGTTGESPTLTYEEHLKVVEVVAEQANGRCQIIAGTGANSTREAVEMTMKAKKYGVDATLQVVPYYNKPTQEGMYRHFNIKTVIGPDDFASMEEVLTRRFKRWESAQEKQLVGSKPDPSFAVLPDLLMVDGGKGQLGRAVKVLESFGLSERVPLVGLAKQQEELFRPHIADSIILPRHSQGLYLIQRVRDEAHRFAITAHRKARGKVGIASRLDAIPGVGPKRRKALLEKFGDIESIRQAPLDELTKIPGITEDIALALQSGLD